MLLHKPAFGRPVQSAPSLQGAAGGKHSGGRCSALSGPLEAVILHPGQDRGCPGTTLQSFPAKNCPACPTRHISTSLQIIFAPTFLPGHLTFGCWRTGFGWGLPGPRLPQAGGASSACWVRHDHFLYKNSTSDPFTSPRLPGFSYLQLLLKLPLLLPIVPPLS